MDRDYFGILYRYAESGLDPDPEVETPEVLEKFNGEKHFYELGDILGMLRLHFLDGDVRKVVVCTGDVDTILRQLHIDPFTGTHTTLMTLENLFKSAYICPAMSIHVANYVAKCEPCIRHNGNGLVSDAVMTRRLQEMVELGIRKETEAAEATADHDEDSNSYTPMMR